MSVARNASAIASSVTHRSGQPKPGRRNLSAGRIHTGFRLAQGELGTPVGMQARSAPALSRGRRRPSPGRRPLARDARMRSAIAWPGTGRECASRTTARRTRPSPRRGQAKPAVHAGSGPALSHARSPRPIPFSSAPAFAPGRRKTRADAGSGPWRRVEAAAVRSPPNPLARQSEPDAGRAAGLARGGEEFRPRAGRRRAGSRPRPDKAPARLRHASSLAG